MHARTFSWNALAGAKCYLCLAILSSAILSGCAGQNAPTGANTPPSSQPEARAVAPSPPVTPSPVAAVVVAPQGLPQATEVEAALARAYQTAVVLADDARGRAPVLTGDFNGDGSQDIAIVVKPNESKLSEINSEFSNWILEDPRRVLMPLQVAQASHSAQASLPPARAQVAAAGDTLLAIIHGYKSEGWRNPDAKQTYLLKNATGTQMRTQMSADERKLVRDYVAAAHLPDVRGDVIWQTLDGKAGCLFWTGAKYAWYEQTPERPLAKAKGKDAAPGR